jgi:DNA-binding transcriptional regulator WhiA
MSIKEIRKILTEIGKLDPHEAKALFEKASNKSVSDEELGKALKSRVTKAAILGRNR